MRGPVILLFFHPPLSLHRLVLHRFSSPPLSEPDLIPQTSKKRRVRFFIPPLFEPDLISPQVQTTKNLTCGFFSMSLWREGPVRNEPRESKVSNGVISNPPEIKEQARRLWSDFLAGGTLGRSATPLHVIPSSSTLQQGVNGKLIILSGGTKFPRSGVPRLGRLTDEV